MAQVPYGEGVPEVAPDTSVPDDYQHIQATPNSFGGLIAQGEEKAGQGITQASTNLFDIAQFRGKVNKDYETTNFLTDHDKILYGDPSKPRMGPDGQPVLGPDGKPMPDTGFMGLDGRAASDQRAATLKALEDRRAQGAQNLSSPQEKYEYNMETRRLLALSEEKINAHTDTQWKGWAGEVNDKGSLQSLNDFTRNLDDTTNLSDLANSPQTPAANHAKDYINFKVQAAQIKYGDDPTIIKGTIEQAKRDLLKAQVLAIDVTNPTHAKEVLDKNKDLAGTEYTQLADHLKTRVDQQMGRTGGTALFAQANSQANAQFAAGQPPAEGAKTLLRSFEGFKPQAYWDVNHWRVGYGSDTITKADGTVVPVTQGMQVSQEDAERDLTRRTADFTQKAQTQIGPDAWGKMTPQAQAVMGSVAYNYGTLPASVVQAAQTGDAGQLSNAVLALGNDNGGANVGRRQAEAGIISGRNTYAIKGDAFRMAIESTQFQNPEQREIALRTISELSNAQEVAYNQSARARIDGVNKAVGDYTTQFWNMLHTPNPDWVGFMGKINADPALAEAGPAKDGLMERIIKRSGEEQSLAFGPGYLGIKDRILSDPGAPGHIGDMSDIYRLPLGQLTATGEKELIGMMGTIKKSPDAYGLQKTQASLENYAKTAMVKEQLIPGMGVLSTNKKGLEIFDSEFVPQLHAAAAQWEKAGKNPLDFWNKKNIDEIMDRVYPKRKRDADNMAAMGEVGGEAENAPLPPTPEGINENSWTAVMAQTPKTSTGQPMNHVAYANKINMLLGNPSPEMIDTWNKSQFGKSGIDGATLVKQLTGKDVAGRPPAAPPPAAGSSDKTSAATPSAPATAATNEMDAAIAARANLNATRREYVKEGLSAIAEGRPAEFSVPVEQSDHGWQKASELLVSGMKSAAENFKFPEVSVHDQMAKWHQDWNDKQSKELLEANLAGVDAQQKAAEKIAHDSPIYAMQTGRLARQRAYLESQLADLTKTNEASK